MCAFILHNSGGDDGGDGGRTAANTIMDNKYSAGQMIFANIIYAFIFNVEIHTHRIIHS